MTDESRVFLRDVDGTGSLHVCAEGDPGAHEFINSLVLDAISAWCAFQASKYRNVNEQVAAAYDHAREKVEFHNGGQP